MQQRLPHRLTLLLKTFMMCRCSARIVAQLKDERLRGQRRDWEAEGRRLAVLQAAYKAETVRLDREHNELAKAWKKLGGVPKR